MNKLFDTCNVCGGEGAVPGTLTSRYQSATSAREGCAKCDGWGFVLLTDEAKAIFELIERMRSSGKSHGKAENHALSSTA